MSVYKNIAPERQPVLVKAVRTPFLDSGGAYADYLHHELAAIPLKAVLDDCPVQADEVELVTVGQVVQELTTTNVAREAMLEAGYPSRIPAYTISMAGVSPNVGLMNICDMIALGRLDTGVAGGAENFSDLPVRMRRNVRKRAVSLALAKTASARLKILSGLRPRDLLPEVPDGVDVTTKMTMGSACEAMASRFAVTREEADAFAARSHQLAAQAWADGHYADDVLSVDAPSGERISKDGSIRGDTSVEKLARLKPAFDKEKGIITPGNASGLTDGAAAMLLMSQSAAQAKGMQPLARVADFQLSGVQDMFSEMLLGPAMSIPPLLARNGLSMDDIAVFELHEAFAAQILANQKALADDDFAQKELGLPAATGAIPLEKLNCWGGSLALGNPFAGTGGRIISTAARRLQQSGERYAIVATCAGGGLGSALLLENPQWSQS